MSFKERVCKELIIGATEYKTMLLDYEYLIYSDKFKNKPYYIIKAYGENYAHLTGVRSVISAFDFFNNCISGTLEESDFDFVDKYKSEKSVIGTVRRKLYCLGNLSDLFSNNLQAEENFNKGRVHCTLAAFNQTFTIGFIETDFLLPQTIMKGDCLNKNNSVDISLVLRRNRDTSQFDTVIKGNAEQFKIDFPTAEIML